MMIEEVPPLSPLSPATDDDGSSSASQRSSTEETNDTLGGGQMLGPWDILCGRCKEAYNNVWNRRFRITIQMHLQKYLDASSRGAKGKVLMSIVHLLTKDAGARFFKQVGDDYIEINDTGIRDKVAHAIRDMSAKYLLNQQKKEEKQQETKRTKQENIRFVSEMSSYHHHSDRMNNSSYLEKPAQHSSSELLRKTLDMVEQSCSSLSPSFEKDDKFEELISKVIENIDVPTESMIIGTTAKECHDLPSHPSGILHG